MDITLPRTRQIELPRNAFVVLRIAISAAALCVLCVVAPGMYATNAALRSFEQQCVHGDALRDKNLERLREQNEAVFLAANNLTSPDERSAFLRDELQRARIEFEGCEMHLRSAQSQLQGMDTFFHRMTGNKLRVYAQRAVRDQAMLTTLAKSHVERLACAANAP